MKNENEIRIGEYSLIYSNTFITLPGLIVEFPFYLERDKGVFKILFIDNNDTSSSWDLIHSEDKPLEIELKLINFTNPMSIGITPTSFLQNIEINKIYLFQLTSFRTGELNTITFQILSKSTK